MTVEFALLEFHIESAIWSLLDLTTLEKGFMGRAVTADLSFRARVDLFSTLVRHRFQKHPDALKQRLNKLIVEMRNAESERNMVVHSTWGLDPEDKDENTIIRIKTTARGKLLATKFEKLTVSDIRTIATRIHAATEGLVSFHFEMSAPNAIVWPPRR